MANYKIVFRETVEKDWKPIPKKDIARIVMRIEQLAQDQRPADARRLVGEDNIYRLRQGNYRILYTVEDDIITITVISVGHRRDIYR